MKSACMIFIVLIFNYKLVITGKDDNLYYNYKTSPLQIKHFSSSNILLENKSEKEIIGYKFGCVKVENGKARNIKSFPLIDLNLESGAGYLEDVLHGNISQYSFVQHCNTLNSTISIVQVYFTDKSNWAAENN